VAYTRLDILFKQNSHRVPHLFTRNTSDLLGNFDTLAPLDAAICISAWKQECLEHFGMYGGWSVRQFRFIFSIWDLMTVVEYNRKVDNANAQLKVMCGRSTNVVFWQHNKQSFLGMGRTCTQMQ